LGWLLTHIGRRTGKRRQTVLEVVEYRKDVPEAVVMSGFGHSDWLLNIQANRNEEIVIGSEHFRASHRVLNEDEASQVLKGYEYRNRLIAPVVRRALSWLAGWPYHGTDGDRHRLASQFPLLAFRPRT
jgi:deazaflavin-dependent oxidoreductase (nitroreductase family)